MNAITESTVLLRTQAVFPDGCKVATEDFDSGWRLMRSGGTNRLAKKVRAQGWSLNRLAEGDLRSGIGSSAQAAVTSALSLGLRRVESFSDAVEVDRVEVTKYPWFFLARVSLHPYCIQPHAGTGDAKQGASARSAGVGKVSPKRSAVYPKSAGRMPILKAMLTSA
jgi:hypothetical protein